MIGSGARVRIGRLFGHDISLDLLSFGLIALIVFTQFADKRMAFAWLLAIFLMVLIHEMGHALSIRKLTGEYTLVIIGWGGLTVSYGRKKPRDQLLISLAGPAAGFAAGVLVWCVMMWVDADHPGWPPMPDDWWAGPLWRTFLYLFIEICLFWSLVNLIPAIPLDGGKALRAGLVLLGLHPIRARRYTRWLALAIAVFGVIWILSAGLDRFFFLFVLIIVMSVIDEIRVEGF